MGSGDNVEHRDNMGQRDNGHRDNVGHRDNGHRDNVVQCL